MRSRGLETPQELWAVAHYKVYKGHRSHWSHCLTIIRFQRDSLTVLKTCVRWLGFVWLSRCILNCIVPKIQLLQLLLKSGDLENRLWIAKLRRSKKRHHTLMNWEMDGFIVGKTVAFSFAIIIIAKDLNYFLESQSRCHHCMISVWKRKINRSQYKEPHQ